MKKFKADKNLRIGIIGAGASGLSAAFFLRKKGYKNITIFEKSDRAGGKCNSVIHDGKVYELGAVLGSSNYDTVEEIMSYLKTEKGGAPDHGFYDFKSEGIDLLIKPEDKAGLFFEQYIRYRTMLNTKYRRILKPGLNSNSPELFDNMNIWAEKKKLNLLAKSFTPLTPTYGYGYFDHIPALYYLKYIKWPQYLNLFKKCTKYTWQKGAENMWQRLSEEFKVVYNCNIKEINRRSNVKISSGEREWEVDKLIISSPLDETMSFMDCSSLEKDIFSKIRTVDYRVFLCEVEGLPHNIGYLLKNVDSSKIGEPMLWYCRYKDSNVYNFYAMGSLEISDDEIIGNIKKAVSKMDGKFDRLIHMKHWRYFPHFSSETLSAGVYDLLEMMQGKRSTYYIGEIMNFSSVEYTTRYAKKLVHKHF